MDRHSFYRIISSMFLAATLLPPPAGAGGVDLPNSFTAGTRARAAEVNANFNAVKTAVDDNDARISGHDTRVEQLETRVATLQAQLAGLQAYIDDLRAVLTLQTDAQGYPAVVFSGVNVHIQNGGGSTETVNGRGNLIVGYNELRLAGISVCSDGNHTSLTNCVNNGGVWQVNHKSGSHNIVLGPYHNYSRYGGLVAGFQNTVNGISAAVSGGRGNIAGGIYSSVSGGNVNAAYGSESSVSGGVINTALGILSSISGGWGNTADESYSSVSGGRSNTASGLYSSISGGSTRTASNTDDWVAGGLLQDN